MFIEFDKVTGISDRLHGSRVEFCRLQAIDWPQQSHMEKKIIKIFLVQVPGLLGNIKVILPESLHNYQSEVQNVKECKVVQMKQLCIGTKIQVVLDLTNTIEPRFYVAKRGLC